ncbi:hypothetical protein SLE2022_057860 [Rubroshorea leprosula]
MVYQWKEWKVSNTYARFEKEVDVNYQSLKSKTTFVVVKVDGEMENMKKHGKGIVGSLRVGSPTGRLGSWVVGSNGS